MYAGAIILLLIIAGASWGETSSGCRFPRQWRGQWYQSGLGEVDIDESSITRKGVCHEQYHDYYLMEKTNEHCHMCMLIVNRHHNILQYKESYCIGKASLRSICDQIRVEAVLYTLVREPAELVPCPFLDAYHFIYNNNSGGFCRSPISYAHQCAGESKFNFKFRHCGHVAYTHDKEVSFQCLATWKDGSQLFMYGGFSGPDTHDKEDVYRCFIYQMLGTVVYVAMSADATCRGLRSQRDGPLVMELTKDVFGWQTTECSYPEWLTQKSLWRDLSGRHKYHVTDEGRVLTVAYQRRPDASSHDRVSFRCMRSWLNDTSTERGGSVTVLAHTLDDCTPKYQCVRMIHRDDHVIEIHRGSVVDQHHSESCGEDRFISAHKQLLFPTDLKSSPCPFTGRYLTNPDHSDCHLELRSGCTHAPRLEIVSSCKTRPLAEMKCLAWWSEGSQILVIAQNAKTNQRLANCFSIRHQGETSIHVAPDHQCNFGVNHIITHDSSSYTFKAQLEECETEEPASDEGKAQTRTKEGDPGGGSAPLEKQSSAKTAAPKIASDTSALQVRGTCCVMRPSPVLWLIMLTVWLISSR